MIDGAYRLYPDQREVCLETSAGKIEYKRRTELMRQRQSCICPACGNPLPEESSTFDHETPRGLGGAFRDDRTERDGVLLNRAVHGWCNSLRGSKRL